MLSSETGSSCVAVVAASGRAYTGSCLVEGRSNRPYRLREPGSCRCSSTFSTAECFWEGFQYPCGTPGSLSAPFPLLFPRRTFCLAVPAWRRAPDFPLPVLPLYSRRHRREGRAQSIKKSDKVSRQQTSRFSSCGRAPSNDVLLEHFLVRPEFPCIIRET